MNKIYDFITIGAGGAGLFLNLNLPKKSSKLILERNNILGIKVLMSGGERANLTNIDIEPIRDYFSCNKKAIIGFLKRWSNYDTINFFETNGVKTKIEDRGRVITASGHAQDLVKVLIEKCENNNVNFFKNIEVLDIVKVDDKYLLQTSKLEFFAKNVIIAVGGKSFPQVGTKGFGYQIAEKFGVNVINSYKGLVGIVLKEDYSVFSGSTINCKIKLKYKDNLVYEEFGPLLFTHWGISGPIVYNLVLGLGQYINCKNKDISYEEFDLEIEFDIENTTKKIKKNLNLSEENNTLKLNIQNLRSWKEAKVTGGGVDTNELTKFLESKKNPGLFFIGEVVDITGKTGGFNLQWAWSSALCCSEKFS